MIRAALLLALVSLVTVAADTPASPASIDLGALADRYGWPTAVILVAGVLLAKGVLRLGRDADALEKQYQQRLTDQAKDYDARLAYADARRREDHDARLDAERRLDQLLPVMTTVTALVQQVKEELIRAGR